MPLKASDRSVVIVLIIGAIAGYLFFGEFLPRHPLRKAPHEPYVWDRIIAVVIGAPLVAYGSLFVWVRFVRSNRK